MSELNTNTAVSVAYAILLAAMVYIGQRWGTLSPGFASPTESGPFFCKELFSSGGDDDAMMGAFTLFVLPLALRLGRLFRPIAKYEVWLFYVCACLVIFSLILASLDCADIFYTAFVIPDPVLAFALIVMPIAALLLFYLRRKSRQRIVDPSRSS